MAAKAKIYMKTEIENVQNVSSSIETLAKVIPFPQKNQAEKEKRAPQARSLQSVSRFCFVAPKNLKNR